MEMATAELAAIEAAVADQGTALQQVTELEIVMLGSGTGDICLG
jgi:hypothetical protein